ncbi:MAG TPA: hypothetical protein VGH64_15690 [Puia sp.]
MKLKKWIPIVTTFLLLVAQVFAQTADEVVNKYFDAIGGKEKLASMKTMYSEGEVIIMNNPAPFVTYTMDGKGYKIILDFNGQKIVNCYVVHSGWTVNPLAGIPDPVLMPADQINIGQMAFDLKGPLFDYAAKGDKLELTGQEKLKDADVYNLKLTSRDSTEMDFYIDASTFYLLKTVVKLKVGGNPFEMTTVNSDFQKTDFGLLMPFKQEVSYPGLTLTSTSKIIDINKSMDESVFAMAKK